MKKITGMLWVAALLQLGLVAHAQEYIGQALGNGGDANPATFHFHADNADFQMLDKNGSPLTRENVAVAYGESLRIYVNGQEATAALALTVEGADLSGTQWTSSAYPASGKLAIDPASGRIKFYTAVWGSPVQIDMITNALDSNSVDLAVNDSGIGMCVFREYTGGGGYFNNYAVRFQPDLGWSLPPVRVDGNQNGEYPKLALTDTGAAFCVKERKLAADNFDVYADRYAPGTGWTGDALVYDPGTVTVLSPRVAAANSGRAIIYYMENISGNYHLMAREFDPVALTWGSAVQIDSRVNTCAASGTAKVVMNKVTGEAICVFAQGTGSGNGVYANHYQPGAGGWTGAQLIAAPYAGEPDVAMNAQGEAVCVYHDYAGTAFSVFYVPGVGWQSRQPIMPAIDGADLNYTVGLDNQGDAVCAISDSAHSPQRIWGARCRRGQSWGSAAAIDLGNGQDAYLNDLQVNGNGLAICGFLQKSSPASYRRGYTNLFTKKDAWLGPVLADANANSNTSQIRLALNSQGAMLAAIVHHNGSQYRVFGRSAAWQIPGGDLLGTYSAAVMATPEPTATPAVMPSETKVKISGRRIYPRNGQTCTIALDMAQSGQATIVVYNLAGDKVKILANSFLGSGQHTFNWSAENQSNEKVASGVYVIHVRIPGIERKEKVVVIK